MAGSVDDTREEHRIVIAQNDIEAILSSIITPKPTKENPKPELSLLMQNYWKDTHTLTLYAFPKGLGMMDGARIKPRFRFQRGPYDKYGALNALVLSPDEEIDFAEIKYLDPDAEKADPESLMKFFSDGPTREALQSDPAFMLITQHDVFLMQPPVKSKTKVPKSEGGPKTGVRGIPLGKFLEALNRPNQAQIIFSDYVGGEEFCTDLLKIIEPFQGLEFVFGIYSRYQRRDCFAPDSKRKPRAGWRGTFDPRTVLGGVISLEGEEVLQPLMQENGCRWEHKVDLKSLDEELEYQLSREIRKLRQQFLIPRTLSKSRSALSLLADHRESGLHVQNELGGYSLRLEVPMKSSQVGDIGERQRLKLSFDEIYRLHPDNIDIVQRYYNLAVGETGGSVYLHMGGMVAEGEKPALKEGKKATIVREPLYHWRPVLSASDLRDFVPNSFEDSYCISLEEAGFTIENIQTHRAYTVSFGKKRKGKIIPQGVSVGEGGNYLSVKYLGVDAEYISQRRPGIWIPRRELHSRIESAEEEITGEMQDIVSYLERKGILKK